MNAYDLLKLNLDIINAYVIHEDDAILNRYWLMLSNSGTFREHSGFIRSMGDLTEAMFASYTTFVDNIPIHLKLNYINFYEEQLGRAWKQLYLDNNDLSKYKHSIDSEYTDYKWYETAYHDLRHMS